jgi:S1-C subfamily serine protease
MRKSLYSSSARHQVGKTPAEKEQLQSESRPSVNETRERAWRRLYRRHEKAALVLAGALVSLAVVFGQAAFTSPPQRLTQDDIDDAVARTLEKKPVPSPAIRAYQAVRPSIVRIKAITEDVQQDDDGEVAHGGHEGAQRTATGSGVVIIDRGVILTCLHVVAGASRVFVMFENGLEAEATVSVAQPENDLAVLEAKQIPDDLKAATLRSAKNLIEGEHVTAVGFPYGIGPSVSAGVISGLRREYASPDGKHSLHDLIQFDAAANPGSSGGPLVNAAGEVIGIVTAILSPGEKAGFSGIAFAVPIETAAGAAGLPPF